MYAKTDFSEATSLTPSSPEHARRPAYYVQSPSRDSRDGEKTNAMTSFQSTPAVGSPMGSPPHSHSSVSRHSRESSTSRFSGGLKPTGGGSTKVSPNDVGLGGKDDLSKSWKECDAIEEETSWLLEDGESTKGWPLRCYVLAFIVGFFVLFSLFALILWGASKPQKPRVAMRSIRFERFAIQAGSDATGVSTEMISMNATVKFTFRNTAKFFGVHVMSTPVALFYSLLNIGSGNMKQFYESRNGVKNVTVVVAGDKVPMYGSGAGLSTSMGVTTLPVALRLEFTVQSRAYVLGKLVRPRFNRKIDCSVVFETKKLNDVMSLEKNCTYV